MECLKFPGHNEEGGCTQGNQTETFEHFLFAT